MIWILCCRGMVGLVQGIETKWWQWGLGLGYTLKVGGLEEWDGLRESGLEGVGL